MAEGLADRRQNGRVEGLRLARARAFYMEAFAEGRPCEALAAHSGERFTQLGRGTKGGKQGFIEFIAGFVQQNPRRHIEIIRSWEDGQFVFLHTRQSLNDGGQELVTTEFFDTDDDGRIVGHWSVTGEFAGPNPSGRTQVDGPTQLVDLERTGENKAIVKEMLENCLFPGGNRPDHIEAYFAEEYLQHNPNVGDGLAIVRQLSQAENSQMLYEEIVLLVGHGNFVAVLCKASWDGAPLMQVDILRLESGKIVEHWDLGQPVPESDLNSGRF